MLIEENERKRMISAEEYVSLTEYFSTRFVPARMLQINYYYDADDFSLFKKGETLRVRQTGNRLKLEYKYGKTVADGVRNCKEMTKKMDCVPQTIVFSDDAGAVYKNVGFMATERTNYIFGGVTVSLDKNYYLGVADYEIEVESAAPAPLPDVILALNLDFSMDAESKYTRFLKGLMNQECRYEI